MKLLNILNNRINNNHGSALVIVLFIVILVSVLGFSLLNISAYSIKQVDYERRDQAVFYIAEAGMTLAKIDVKNQVSSIQVSASKEIKDWIDAENKRRKNNKMDPLTKDIAIEHYRTILNNKFSVFTPNLYEPYLISNGKKAKITLNTQLPAVNENLVYLISITSTGYIDSAKERVVTQEIKIKPELNFGPSSETDESTENNTGGQTAIGTPEGYAVLTRGDIIFNSSGKIYGNTTLSQGNIVFKNGGAMISGVASIDKNTQKITLENSNQSVPIVDPFNINVRDYLSDDFFPIDKFSSNHINSINTFKNTTVSGHLIYNNGDFKANDYRAANFTIDLTNQSSIRFNNFIVDAWKNIYIDVGEGDTDLYINNLNINGNIYIKGSGKLNIYINNFTQLKGSFNNTGNSSQVNFIYNGSKPFNLDGNTMVYGSLINNTANISIGASSAFHGNIVSKGNAITMSGSSPVQGQSIIAPYATLTMGGSSKIYGTTIVDNINFIGNSQIHYGTPIFPLPPGVGPGTGHTDLPPPDNYDFSIIESNMVEQ